MRCVLLMRGSVGLGRVVELQTLFTRGLCHLTGDGKNKTMKQMDKNCKLSLSGFLSLNKTTLVLVGGEAPGRREPRRKTPKV